MTSKVFPRLDTERLDLCEITRGHAEWYLEHFSVPEIAHGQGYPPPKDLEAATKELDQYIVGLFEDGHGLRWGIRLKGAADMIGSVGFYAWDRDIGKAKMGYDLRPAYWGKGIMTEALSRVIRYGFEEMKLNRIEASAMEVNDRSVALLERMGFVKEGVLREWSKCEGRLVDEHLFAMLRSDEAAKAICRATV